MVRKNKYYFFITCFGALKCISKTCFTNTNFTYQTFKCITFNYYNENRIFDWNEIEYDNDIKMFGVSLYE